MRAAAPERGAASNGRCTGWPSWAAAGQTDRSNRGGVPMAELVVDFITSLDGYASAEGWPGWWGLEGPEYLAWLGENPEADYLLLMGANTYRLMYGFTKEAEPGTAVLGGMSKIVFSSTLGEPLGEP